MNRYINTAICVILLVIAGCGSGSGNSGATAGGGTRAAVIPTSTSENCIGWLTGDPSEISAISTIGGAWTRPHAGPFVWGYIETSNDTYSYDRTDEAVTAAQNANVAILGTIWPFASWDQSSCRASDDCNVSTNDQFYPHEIGDEIPISRCAPCSYDDYQEFLGNLVERYDGDSTSDMSGLTIPVKYWEILNEPSMGSDELTFYKGTKAQYVEILQKSYETIKSVCSDCVVVQGGTSGNSATAIAYWGDIFDLGGGDFFDIANIHYINSGDLATLNVSDFESLLDSKGLDKPIWVTEAEFSSEDEVTAAVQGALAAGATKVFFTQFDIGGGYSYEGTYSAVYDGISSECP